MRRRRLTIRGSLLLIVVLLALSVAVPAGAQEGPSSSSDPGIPAFSAQYFNNGSLAGTPALERTDAAIDFEWVLDSPAPGVIEADGFSARWTNTVPSVPAGVYRFVTTTDDGVRLWINNRLVIDHWTALQERTFSALVRHPGGALSIRMEVVEQGLAATAKLHWFRLNDWDPEAVVLLAFPVVPENALVKDSSDSVGVLMDGPHADFLTAAQGGLGNSSYLYSKNSPALNSRYNWVRWFPFVPAGPAGGRYEVYVYIPAEHSTATLVRYWVRHSGGYTKVEVSQAAHAGELVSLGVYTFKGRNWEFVSASDVSFEPEGTTEVAFDAVVLVPR